ncbi:MAG: hypothetical protein IT371_05265 [Deltaproteobacteria bacterium]|nr:hypothetical protein [Deltaproteobacteria bacterium]
MDGDEQAVCEAFHRWGFSDGLPIVAPTRERVDAMCAAATRYPLESLGAVAPSGGPATVQKLAINAVMAGCLPEHFPVLMAAVEAVLEPAFNLIGVQTTTHPCGVMLLVHGPIARELGLNAGPNCLGQGNRANASLGRALRLVLQNVGGALPGGADRATQGSPAKVGFCFAENEAESPWPPLRTVLGFSAEESCVTVAATEGPHNINDHGSSTAESLLTTVAETMATVGNNNLYVGGDTFLVLGPEHARTIADGGFDRAAVQAFLYERARVSVERIGAGKLAELTSWGGYKDKLSEWGGRIPLVREPESLRVLVAGGPGKHSAWCPTFAVGFSVTRRIVREGALCRL